MVIRWTAWHTVAFIVISTLRWPTGDAQIEKSIVDYSSNNNLNKNFTWTYFNLSNNNNNNNKNNNNVKNTLFGSLFPAFILPKLPSLFTIVTTTTTTSTTTTTVVPEKLTRTNHENTVVAPKARASPTFATHTVAAGSGGRGGASNIRFRLNEPFFQETAKFFHGVFSHEARRVRIRPQRQCFPEGCFESDAFRIVGFRSPAGLTLRPTAPNRLVLSLVGFDVDITGRIDGNVQLLLTSVPLTGRLHVTARQLILSAWFDLQKSAGSYTPFLQMHDCQLRAGHVDTRVADVGLLTDSINLKYKNEMIGKSKEMITSTICEQIDRIIQAQVNARLRQIPRRLAVSQILKAIIAQPIEEDDDGKAGSDDDQTDEENEETSNRQTKRQQSANIFDLVPERRRSLRYRSRRRRRRDTGSIRTTVKIAKQQTAVEQSVIPEQEEEEQKKLSQQQQQPQQAVMPHEDGATRRQSSRETAAGPPATSGVVTLVESTRHVAPKAHVATNKTSATVAGGSKRQSPSTAKSAEKSNKNNNSNNKNNYNSAKNKENINKDSNEYYSDVKATVDDDTDFFDAPPAAATEAGSKKIDGKLSDLLELFDLNALGRLFVDLDFLDSSASVDAFTVGLSGGALAKVPQAIPPAGEIAESMDGAPSRDRRLLAEFDDATERQRRRPPLFPTAHSGRRQTLEIAVAKITPNLLLFQAHRARLLKIRVGADAPIFGRLLRTNCGPDEICLSDSVPEVGERFPGDQQLELIIETIRVPRLVFTKDSATLHFAAAANFFLAGSCRPIGRLPFIGSAQIRARMSTVDPQRVNIGLKLTRLELLDQLDFFGLRRDALDGLREAVRGTLEHTARRLLAGGVNTRVLAARLARYGVGDVALRLTDDGIILLQANLDVYRFAFETSDVFVRD